MSGVDEVLRRATEVAFVVAVTGARARPPIPPPNPLKPYLRFQKLPAAALGPVRRSVEADGEFRARVAEVATEELVGRAGWLWLHRPEGWEPELEALAREAEQAAAAEGDERDERRARRRVDAAEQACARAAAEAATARGETEAVRAELDAERRERRTAREAIERLERRVAQLDVELTAARRRLADAEGRATDALERAHHADQDLEAARARALELARALEEAEVRASIAATATATAAPVVPDPPGRTAPDPAAADGPLDRDRLAVVLERAASATAALAEALGDAATLVEPPPPPAPPERVGPPPVPVARRTPRAPRPRRTPLALPGGIMGDSVSAAEHLVKADRVLLVIDGYNAAKLAWPGEPLAEQRQRLLDVVDELVMRHGTDTTVVFDGADVASAVPLGRRLGRTTFSPPGTPADDVIVDLVRRTPAERPVIVATNDRAVRAAARSGGANLISSEQLLAVARR